jgi:hypothetical protein
MVRRLAPVAAAPGLEVEEEGALGPVEDRGVAGTS